MLNEIKFTVATRNSGKMSEKIFKNVIYQLEVALTTFTPIKADGLSQITNDPDLLDTFKEFQLENLSLVYISPKYRLIYAIISAIANLHMINSKKQVIDINKPINNILTKINNNFNVDDEENIITEV